MSDSDVDMTRGVYRRIYSGATKGRRINSVTVLAELLFWRLNLVADDFGTFEADPYLIQCSAMPLRRNISEQQIADALAELAAANLVDLYTAEAEQYGHIVGFESFQPAPRNGRRIKRYPTPDGESGGVQMNRGEPKKSKSPHTQSHTHTEARAQARAQARADTQPETEGPALAGADRVKALPVDIPEELRTDAFRRAWDTWQRHRREIRKTLTPLAATKQLAELAKMGEPRAIAAIEHSIKQGWTGIFEEKNHGSQDNNRRANKAEREFAEDLRL